MKKIKYIAIALATLFVAYDVGVASERFRIMNNIINQTES